MVAVDDMAVRGTPSDVPAHSWWEGIVNGETVVAFPIDTNFRLFARRLINVVTPVEAAQRQKTEEEEITAILGPEKVDETTPFNAAAYR